MIALFTTVIPTAQRLSTYNITKVPTAHVYKLCTDVDNSSLLLSFARGIGKVGKWAA
jgi:hypothetical protein